MVMTTVGEEGRSGGYQETTLWKEPTLTGVFPLPPLIALSHNRTLAILDMVCTSLSSWISDGLFSLSTLYGIGILNEPHICGPWYDEPLYGPACMQDFYPKAYNVVRKYFAPEDVKASVAQSMQAKTPLGGGGHCSQGVFCL